jgi:hypothetical protein
MEREFAKLAKGKCLGHIGRLLRLLLVLSGRKLLPLSFQESMTYRLITGKGRHGTGPRHDLL